MLAGPNGQRSLDACHIGGRRQLAGKEFLETLKIAAHDFENKVDFPVEHVDFAHFGQIVHGLLEGPQCIFCLAFQTDHREDGDAESQLRSVQLGMIASDDPIFFQRPHPAQTGGSGQTDSVRQFDIGDAPLVLEFSQQMTVDFVEIGHDSCPTVVDENRAGATHHRQDGDNFVTPLPAPT